jgi:hypothetical protein
MKFDLRVKKLNFISQGNLVIFHSYDRNHLNNIYCEVLLQIDFDDLHHLGYLDKLFKDIIE